MPPPLPRYLCQQGNRYWARFRVPDNAREAFDGKREHWVNLGTDDVKLAAARVHRAASNFRARVLEGRGKAGSVEADALEWRRLIEQDSDDGGDTVGAAIREASARYVRGGYKAVTRAADLFHDGSEGDALLGLGGPQARTFVDIAIHGKKPLLPFVAPWAIVRAAEVEAKTAAMDETAVRRLAQAFPLASDVTKAGVSNWIQGRKADVSSQTVQREVSGIRNFWSYLRAREEIPSDAADPFADLKFKDRQRDVAKARRQPFTAAEVSALYKTATADRDGELADLLALGAYTGARREELAALKIADVGKGWIVIRSGEAKSEAGSRDVPVHPKIAPVLARLIGKRKAGYVFAALDVDKYGKRGDAVGKRFSRLKSRLGHGETKTFHSIRHTVVHLLEAAGVAENLTADIVGHKKTTMSYGLYSGRGATRGLLPTAIAAVRYPKPLGG